MNRLIIKLNTITENVTSDLITKLYNIAKRIKDYEELNEIENSQVQLLGNLLTVNAFDNEVTYLETKFSPNLHINVTGRRYIKFQDPLVETILKSINVGDGTGITSSDLYSIASLSGSVFGGSSIISFNELLYFNPAILSLANLFSGCTSLTEITLPVGTTLIRNDWFKNCSNLINIGNTLNVTSINGLGNCSSLVSIDTPTLTTVGNWGCQNCTSLTTIDLSHCTSIGRNAFQGCTSLDNIDLSNCTTISQEAFKECTSLTSVDLSNVTSISSSAFLGCSSLTSVGNLSNCTSIGRNTFDGCLNLDKTDWDLSNITSLGQYCFAGCSKLKGTLNLSGVLTIDLLTTGLFSKCSSLLKIILGHISSVETSRMNANRSTFYQCDSLKVVDINQLDGIMFSNQILIDNNVFLAFIIRNTNTIPTITLDLGVNYAAWSKLTSSSNAKIYVDNNLYSTYINHTDWSDLASHIEPLSNYVES